MISPEIMEMERQQPFKRDTPEEQRESMNFSVKYIKQQLNSPKGMRDIAKHANHSRQFDRNSRSNSASPRNQVMEHPFIRNASNISMRSQSSSPRKQFLQQ